MKKQEKFYTEEQKEIQNFVKILIGLIIIVAIFYLLTVFVFNKSEPYKRTDVSGSVQYNSIILGTLLNRADDEYYVLAFDSDDASNTYIINKASSYASNEENTPLYTADLSLEFNKKFLSDKSNYTEDNVNDLSLKGTTLIKVKNGRITKFIDDISLIEKELN